MGEQPLPWPHLTLAWQRPRHGTVPPPHHFSRVTSAPPFHLVSYHHLKTHYLLWGTPLLPDPLLNPSGGGEPGCLPHCRGSGPRGPGQAQNGWGLKDLTPQPCTHTCSRVAAPQWAPAQHGGSAVTPLSEWVSASQQTAGADQRKSSFLLKKHWYYSGATAAAAISVPCTPGA